MSNWCVEYWRIPKQPAGSHAQMKEQLKYVKPDFKDIGRRYFTDYISATRYASSLFDSGNYHTNIIKG